MNTNWCHIKEKQKLNSSGEDGLLSSFLGEDGTRFVLGVGMVCQLGRAGGHGAFQDGLFEVIEHGRVLFGQEGHGYTTLTSTTRSANTMDII